MSETVYLPGFSHRLCGRPAVAATSKVQRRTNRLDELASLGSRFILAELFVPGETRRQRIYTPWVTFIAFSGHVLTRGSACRGSVRRGQTWCVADERTAPTKVPVLTVRPALGCRSKRCVQPTKSLEGGSSGAPRTRGAGATEP